MDFKILISKFWPLGEGFRGFGPQIRLQHAEISPGTNSEVIWLELNGFPNFSPVGSYPVARPRARTSIKTQGNQQPHVKTNYGLWVTVLYGKEILSKEMRITTHKYVHAQVVRTRRATAAHKYA